MVRVIAKLWKISVNTNNLINREEGLYEREYMQPTQNVSRLLSFLLYASFTCVGLRIERSGQVRALADTLLPQCLSPPRSMNGYRQTVRGEEGGGNMRWSGMVFIQRLEG